MDLPEFWIFTGVITTCIGVGFGLYRSQRNRIRDLSKDRERLRLALDHAPNAFWDWNVSQGELFVSSAFIKQFGNPTDQPQNPFELIANRVHSEDRDRVLDSLRQSIKQCAINFKLDYRQQSATGEFRHVCLYGAVVATDFNGEASRVVAWLNDATAFHLFETRYREAAKQAELTTQLKNNILSTLSHEIRTPLNAISGLSRLALQTNLNTEQRELIANIDKSGSKLLDTINDIFEFSNLESGQVLIESRNFHFYDIFEPVVDFFHFRETQPDIDILFDIQPDVPHALNGDPLRVGQILRHLCVMVLENSSLSRCVIQVAIKTQTNKKVSLHFSVKELEPSSVAENTQTSYHSNADKGNGHPRIRMGLSLSICRHIIDLMGGEFLPEPPQPSTIRFDFILEFGVDGCPDTQTLYRCPPAMLGTRILVLEPEFAARKSLCQLLDSFGFEPIVCDDLANTKDIALNPTGQSFGLVIVSDHIVDQPENQVLTHLKQLSQEIGLKIMVTLSSLEHPRVHDFDSEVKTKSRLIKPLGPSLLFKSVCRVLTRVIKNHDSLAQTPAQEQSPAKILLVEDNRVNLQIAQELLVRLGTLVNVAMNGTDALAQVNSNEFDLVFMDIQMPEMDGFAATQSIRLQSRFEHLPIIAMTAHATERDREKAFAAGMNDFISKPIDGMKLHRMLCRWLPWAEFHTIPMLDNDDTVAEAYQGWSEINYAAGLLHVGQNALLYNRLLGEFYRDHNRDAEIINNALLNGDLETAHRLTHTLYGICANIAANRLHNSAKTLNRSIRHQKREAIRNHFLEFCADYDRTMSELKAHPEIHTRLVARPEASEFQPISLKEIVSRLNTLLSQGDSEALDLLNELGKSLSSEMQLGSQFEELSSQLSYYQFDEAQQTLANIANSLNIELSE